MTVGSVGLDNDVVDSLHRGDMTSRIATLDTLERLLARGDFDLVGVGRALLADAQRARKVARGEFGSLQGFARSHLELLT